MQAIMYQGKQNLKQGLLMKMISAFCLVLFMNYNAFSQTKVPEKVIKDQVVDIACGECQFKMKGKDCELAVKINGKPYFVDGKGIDDFGDAHGTHGFCNAVSKAKVSGTLINNRFKAKSIVLLNKN